MSQVRDANKREVYQAYGFLCETYAKWDNIQIAEAKKALKNLLSPSGHVLAATSFRKYTSEFEKQQQALKCLEQIVDPNDPTSALDIPNGFHFAFMLYHKALRHESQKQLDVACLLLYRLLEWIEQHRLWLYSIDTAKPDYSNVVVNGEKVAENILFSKYSKKRSEIFKTSG